MRPKGRISAMRLSSGEGDSLSCIKRKKLADHSVFKPFFSIRRVFLALFFVVLTVGGGESAFGIPTNWVGGSATGAPTPPAGSEEAGTGGEVPPSSTSGGVFLNGGPFEDILDLSKSGALTATIQKVDRGNLALFEGTKCLTDKHVCDISKYSFDIARNMAAAIALKNDFSPSKKYFEAYHGCLKEAMESGKTEADATAECYRKESIYAYHPSASEQSGTSDGAGMVKLSDLLFPNQNQLNKLTELPHQRTSDESERVKILQLNAEQFRCRFGDIYFADKREGQITKVSIQRIDPWTACKQRKEEWEAVLDQPKALQEKCKQPVTLENTRYCLADYFHSLITWSMKTRCDFYNASAVDPVTHQPLIPSCEQQGSSGFGLEEANTQPGPFCTKREDWDRVVRELTIPGHEWSQGTVESLFYSYWGSVQKGVTGSDILTDPFSLVFNQGMGNLGISCLRLDSTAGAFVSFPLVVKDFLPSFFPRYSTKFGKISGDPTLSIIPRWSKAASSYANARAGLHVRDIVSATWYVVQQQASSLEEEVQAAARMLVENAYPRTMDQKVIEDLKLAAKEMELLEKDADLARTKR